jgi:hypothetical protein
MIKPIHTIIAALLLSITSGEKLLATQKKEEISISYQEIYDYRNFSESAKLVGQNIKIKSKLRKSSGG